jgi:TonB family protein
VEVVFHLYFIEVLFTLKPHIKRGNMYSARYYVIIILSLFCILEVNGQDTTYFAGNFKKKVQHLDSADRIVVVYNKHTPHYTIKHFTKEFKTLKEASYGYNAQMIGVLDGTSKKWDEAGKLTAEVGYKNGMLNGSCKLFWPNGKVKRDEVYKDGILEKGKCYDSLRNQTQCGPFTRIAMFPGGQAKISEYLSANLKYPKEAVKRGEEGVVYVSFVVDEDGNVAEAKIDRGISMELNEEALRVVKEMPKWEPGYDEGEISRTRTALPVRFRLN